MSDRTERILNAAVIAALVCIAFFVLIATVGCSKQWDDCVKTEKTQAADALGGFRSGGGFGGGVRPAFKAPSAPKFNPPAAKPVAPVYHRSYTTYRGAYGPNHVFLYWVPVHHPGYYTTTEEKCR